MFWVSAIIRSHLDPMETRDSDGLGFTDSSVQCNTQ